MLLEMIEKDDEDLIDFTDGDDDDLLSESNKWRDSDDDDSENDFLQHSKDYAKFLDSSSDSSSEIEHSAGRRGDLERGNDWADEDSDADPDVDELLPGRDAELGHLIDGDDGKPTYLDAEIHSATQGNSEEIEEDDRDSDECEQSLGI